MLQTEGAECLGPTFNEMTPEQLLNHAAWLAEYRGLAGLDETIKGFDAIKLYLPGGEVILSPEEEAFLDAAQRVLTTVKDRCRKADLPSS